MNDRRIVITGMGTVNALGLNVNDFWEGLKAGKSGISRVTNLDLKDSPCLIGGEVKDADFNVEDYIDRKDARKMDRFCHFAIVAAREAIKESGLSNANVDKENIGVIIASGIGGIHTYYDNAVKMFSGGRKKVSPFFIPMLIADIASGYISIEYGYHGPNYAVASACASAGNGIACAFNHILVGDADVMITGDAKRLCRPSDMPVLPRCRLFRLILTIIPRRVPGPSLKTGTVLSWAKAPGPRYRRTLSCEKEGRQNPCRTCQLWCKRRRPSYNGPMPRRLMDRTGNEKRNEKGGHKPDRRSAYQRAWDVDPSGRPG